MASPKLPAWPEGQPPATGEEFFACLDASGISTSEIARRALAATLPEPAADAPQTLANALVAAGQLTRLQARALLAGKIKFLQLGDYVILEKLGQGGMGKVFKAEHRRMKRTVAIKVIATAALQHADAVRRFEREVQAAARLIHPNIVTAFDANEFKGVHYFVMEYVAGRDLHSVLAERGRLPLAMAVDYIAQAARGLAYAHRQGVIHRDVKPGNLLVDREGTVKILDLGLACIDRSLGENTELTDTGQVMGTIDYMAPEQAESTRLADARSDIYSLGCTFYRLVNGEPMFSGDSLISKLLAHRTAPVPALLSHVELNDELLASRLEQTFRKMVAKSPADRFESMDLVVTELEAWVRDYRAVTPEPIALEPTTNFTAHQWQPGVSSTSTHSSVARPVLVATAARQEATANFSAVDTSRSISPIAVEQVSAATHRQQRSQSRAKSRRGTWIALGGAMAALMMLAAGVIFFIPTAHGTLRVEINDPSIEVTVAETGYKIKGKTEEVTLQPGERTLHVKSGELEFDTQKFVLRQGENPAVVVELLHAEVRVVQNGKLLGAKQRAAKHPPTAKPETPAADTLEQRMAKMPAPEFDGDWQLRDGSLIVPVTKPTRMFYLRFGDPAWTDYDVEAHLTVHERWPSEFGLLARAEGIKRWQYIVGGFADMSNRDLLPFTTEGDAWRSPARRFMAGQRRVQPNSMSKVMLRVRGNTATTFLDDEQVATSEHDQLPAGRAGICTFGNSLFHDIIVRSSTGEILWQGLPQLPPATEKDKTADAK